MPSPPVPQVSSRGGRILQQLGEIVTVEDVVTQNQRAGIIADEPFADDKCLGQPFRIGLHLVLYINAPLAAVAEQLLEARRIQRCRDNQDVADVGQQQH